jgi:hypothetical protein
MKKCSAALAIKEMQIKTTLRFYLTPVRRQLLRKTINVGEDMRKGTLICYWWECKLVKPLQNQYGGSSKELL